ncbi:MAG: hypothetical protein WCE79_12255 [Xanthobacteraceae bacterium]
MSRLIKTLILAALWSLPASYSHASCTTDGVSAKTDTTISIYWDVSGCNRLSAYATFRICWKYAGNTGNACIPPTIDNYGESGTTTLTGLSPATPYRIRTLWHHRSWGWLDVNTRTVTTNAGPAFTLRYEKGGGHPYCVYFYWKNVPAVQGPRKTVLILARKFLSGWFIEGQSPDVSNAAFNIFTGEYYSSWCKFYESRTYRAIINLVVVDNHGNESVAASTNQIQWH